MFLQVTWNWLPDNFAEGPAEGSWGRRRGCTIAWQVVLPHQLFKQW